MRGTKSATPNVASGETRPMRSCKTERWQIHEQFTDTLESTDFPKHNPSSLPKSNSLYCLSTDSGSDLVLRALYGFTHLIFTPIPWGRCQREGRELEFEPDVWFQSPNCHKDYNIFSTKGLQLVLLKGNSPMLWAFIYFSVSLNHNC